MGVRIVIADDHPVVRTGMHGILVNEPDFEVVGEASTGREAVDINLRMPEMDGVEAISRIVAEQPDAHVLVLTTYDGDADIVRAVGAGATGYLLKDTPREELCRAIRATARGEPVLAPVVAARLMGRVRQPEEEALSGRELEVLKLVAGGISNKEVGGQLHISEATVKSHLSHIFGKLGVDDRTAAVTVALERGILQLGRS